jgi:hypothetical protein
MTCSPIRAIHRHSLRGEVIYTRSESDSLGDSNSRRKIAPAARDIADTSKRRIAANPLTALAGQISANVPYMDK